MSSSGGSQGWLADRAGYMLSQLDYKRGVVALVDGRYVVKSTHHCGLEHEAVITVEIAQRASALEQDADVEVTRRVTEAFECCGRRRG